jgi:hypothetical protein
MNRLITRGAAVALLLIVALLPLGPVAGQLPSLPPACENLAFSIEEDFYAPEIEFPDGNQIVSDGDLLALDQDADGNLSCLLCARNADLLWIFDVGTDLGLDAIDVIDAETALVAFSTELNGPRFTQGDLLATNGVIIRNQALTFAAFDELAPGYDIGLDAVHFTGTLDEIVAFLDAALEKSPVDPTGLADLFEAYPGVDVLYSTEGTLGPVDGPKFLDGDLLSARNGTIVASNAALLPASVPAGIPDRGVDFGLDAVTSDRQGSLSQMHFSTEILFDGESPFTDGDVLRSGDGVVYANQNLISCFGPQADFLGLDALHLALEQPPPSGTIQGHKFHDLDADGVADAGEPGLGQWEIHLDGYDVAGSAVNEVTSTDATGVYSFTVSPGTYTVSEVCSPGAAWHQSLPLPSDDVCGTGVYEVNVAAGDPPHLGLDFGNYLYVAKSGYKFDDLSQDGVWDEREPPLVEWEIRLDGSDGLGNVVQKVAHTNANGYYSFSVAPGSYTVYEVCPPDEGWHQTLPAGTGECGSGRYPFKPLSSDPPHEGNDFGNYQIGSTYLPLILKVWP